MGSQSIQPLPVAAQLSGLSVPGPLVLDGDVLRDEGEIDAGNKPALAVRHRLLGYGPQTGQYEGDAEARLLRRFGAPVGKPGRRPGTACSRNRSELVGGLDQCLRGHSAAGHSGRPQAQFVSSGLSGQPRTRREKWVAGPARTRTEPALA